MRRWLLLALSVAPLSGCMNEGEFRTVYQNGPVVQQCGPVVVTLEQSKAQLAAAGVQALRSSCGVKTGVFYPTVCGAPNWDILLHDIRAEGVAAALDNGFALADDLPENPETGRGWARRDCIE